MFDFIRNTFRKRKFKKNYQSKRYRYDTDGVTKIYLDKESN